MLKGARTERICLEATGAYHLDLALALDAAGLAVMVVNPKAARRPDRHAAGMGVHLYRGRPRA
jgi:transposase